VALLSIIPPGLLSFFGIKNGGQFPQALSTNLAPVIDMYEHYAAGAAIATAITFTVPPTNAGNGNIVGPWGPIEIANGISTQVPNNEFWFVLDSSIRVVFTGGDATEEGDFILGWSPTGITTNFFGFPYGERAGFQVQGAGANNRAGFRAQVRPVWVPPGSVIQYFQMGSISAATLNITAALRFARFTL